MSVIFRIMKATYAVISLISNENKWTCIHSLDVPQQQNQYDCGAHVIANKYRMANNIALPTYLPPHKTRN